MASSRSTQHELDAQKQPSHARSTLAHPLAPEDVRPGDFVTPLYVIAEVPSFYWCGETWDLPRDELVRIRSTSCCDGIPLRVKSVCLPFVLAKHPHGNTHTIDLRRCHLVRLDRRYGRRAWKAFKKARRKGLSI